MRGLINFFGTLIDKSFDSTFIRLSTKLAHILSLLIAIDSTRSVMATVPPRDRSRLLQTGASPRKTAIQASSSHHLSARYRPYRHGLAHSSTPIANSIFRRSVISKMSRQVSVTKRVNRKMKAGKLSIKPTSKFAGKSRTHIPVLPNLSPRSTLDPPSDPSHSRTTLDRQQRTPYRTRSGAKPSRWTLYMMRSRLCEVPTACLFPDPIHPSPHQLERIEARGVPQRNLCFSAAKKDVIQAFVDAGRPANFSIPNPKVVGFMIEELLAESSSSGTGTPAAPLAGNEGVVGEDTAYTRTF